MSRKNKQTINRTLKDVKCPKDLACFNDAELNSLAQEMREQIIDAVSINGGHLSSNLGTVEATIALCRTFDFTKDKIIFDVGHQSYSYKLLTGRTLKNLRRKDGVAGFQKMDESPYDHFECGHSSTSISAACGMAYARDLKKENYNVISFIGDSSFANGLSLEALNFSSEYKNKIIIVVNNNDMSISKPVGGFSKMFRSLSTSKWYAKRKERYVKAFKKEGKKNVIYNISFKLKNWAKKHLMQVTFLDELGYSIVGPIDGHNIKDMEKAFERAKISSKSCVVLIKTTKGKGYAPCEKDSRGVWHGVSSFDKSNPCVEEPKDNSWSVIYSEATLELMRKHKDSIFLVAATGIGSAASPINEEFPSRTIDVGIAEEHAITMASGLAVSGYHPIINLYSTFLQRGYDEISHDLSRLKCCSTLLIDRASFSGGDGDTHQGIYDVSFLYSIPDVTITMATRYDQIPSLMEESYKHNVFAIRYPRGNYKYSLASSNLRLPYGKWIKEKASSSKKVIISVGPMTLDLIDEVNIRKLDIEIYSAVYLRPFDEKVLNNLIDYKEIVIYDPYSVKSGFASHLEARLLELGYRGKIVCKTIPDKFIPKATVNEQLEENKLTVNDLLDSII